MFWIFLLINIFNGTLNYFQNNNKHVKFEKNRLKNAHLNNSLPLLVVSQVDSQLQQMAKNYIDHEFIHPLSENLPEHPIIGHKMKTVKEIFQATKILIKPEIFCKQTYCSQLLLVVFIPVATDNFKKRKIIRKTYGSILKNNPKTSLYFFVGTSNNSL